MFSECYVNVMPKNDIDIWPRNVVKCSICCQNVRPSIRPFHCHTRESRGSRYRNYAL